MGLLVDSLLLATVLAAAFFDLRERRVPNLLTFPAILLGLALSASDGLTSFGWHAGATLLALLIGFVFYATGVMGGGDGKLLAAIAAFRGLDFLGASLLWALVVGGVVSALLLLRRRELLPFFRRFFDVFVGFALSRHLDAEELLSRRGHMIPLAVIIAIGVVTALAFEWYAGAAIPF